MIATSAVDDQCGPRRQVCSGTSGPALARTRPETAFSSLNWACHAATNGMNKTAPHRMQAAGERCRVGALAHAQVEAVERLRERVACRTSKQPIESLRREQKRKGPATACTLLRCGSPMRAFCTTIRRQGKSPKSSYTTSSRDLDGVYLASRASIYAEHNHDECTSEHHAHAARERTRTMPAHCPLAARAPFLRPLALAMSSCSICNATTPMRVNRNPGHPKRNEANSLPALAI